MYPKNKSLDYIYAFIIGFVIALITLFYKYFNFDLLNTDFETTKYLIPALVLNETNSIIHFKASLFDRLPIYPIVISLILKFFGTANYFAILFFQSILNGLILLILIATKNLFTNKYYWLSIFLLALNINFFWSSSIILPDILNVFFISCAIYFFLKFILKKQSINLIIIGSIFFGLSFLTKPSGILLPIFLFFFLIIYFLFKKKYKLTKVLIFSILPITIIALISSPLYLFNYKKTGQFFLTDQKGTHLLFWIYPCIVKKWGCGARDQDVIKKVVSLSEIELKKEFGTDFKSEYPYAFDFENDKLRYSKNLSIEENYFKNIALRSKINEKIFFNLVKEEDKIQILTSFIGSVSKMLLHTSIIGIFEQHDISYKELKSIITLKKNNVTISGTIWLISQIIIIFLRILQFYGCVSVFKKNEKKNTWLVIFLLLISLPFIISTLGIGNPRYRISIEPILFLLTIIGVKNLNKKYKNK